MEKACGRESTRGPRTQRPVYWTSEDSKGENTAMMASNEDAMEVGSYSFKMDALTT